MKLTHGCFILQSVVQPVRMEELVFLHHTTTVYILYTSPTVTVPVGIQDITASTEVTTAHNHKQMHGKSWSIRTCTWLFHIYFQTVSLPVRMEEYVVVTLPMLTVTVSVGTQDPTARTEVCMHI